MAPGYFISKAKQLVGGLFSLDPCSTQVANRNHVGKIAHTIFTKENNGLRCPWFGNVWLFPPCTKKYPSGESQQQDWFTKAESDYNSKNITSCLLLMRIEQGSQWMRSAASLPSCLLFDSIHKDANDSSAYMLIYM